MFESEYASEDLIPAEVRHLYKESGDKYVLIAKGEMKTQGDVTRLEGALEKERNDHKDTKGKLRKFGDLDPDETLSKLDRIDELEAAAGDKLDDEKINELVEKRINGRVAPLERKIKTLEEDNAEKDKTIGDYSASDRKRKIEDHVREHGEAAKLTPGGLLDALVLGERVFDVNEQGDVVTKDSVGVTPGVSADVWLAEMQDTRSHWWPESKGGGSRGGTGGAGGTNPFSAKDWNMTEQGRMVQTDRNKAEQMAKAAGTTIGGTRPAETA